MANTNRVARVVNCSNVQSETVSNQKVPFRRTGGPRFSPYDDTMFLQMGIPSDRWAPPLIGHSADFTCQNYSVQECLEEGLTSA